MTSPLRQKTSFIDPHGKMKIPNSYCTSARHVQSYPRVLIVYSWKCRWSSVDKLYRKRETSVFDHHLTTRDKNKIPKLYYTSTRHSQSYPRVSFNYSIKCRQGSLINKWYSYIKMSWSPDNRRNLNCFSILLCTLQIHYQLLQRPHFMFSFWRLIEQRTEILHVQQRGFKISMTMC